MRIKQKIKNLIKPKTVVYSPITTIKESEVLKGRHILITGGNSGIGKAIAIACVKRGAQVTIVGRNKEKLTKVSEEIGALCNYAVLDLSKDISEDFFNSISNMPITDLVNNAGIYVDYKSLNYSYKDFDDIFYTNSRSPFMLSQYFIKYLKTNDIRGSIIFTTSNRSLMGDDGPYGMSKAAINNLIEGLAREYVKDGIRVNGVAPGMTASNINGIDTKGDLSNSWVKGGRTILPEEIAEVVSFLLSPNSKCVTGAIIPCDDGDRLR